MPCTLLSCSQVIFLNSIFIFFQPGIRVLPTSVPACLCKSNCPLHRSLHASHTLPPQHDGPPSPINQRHCGSLPNVSIPLILQGQTQSAPRISAGMSRISLDTLPNYLVSIFIGLCKKKKILVSWDFTILFAWDLSRDSLMKI